MIEEFITAIPVELKPMSIITLILLVVIFFVIKSIYIQIGREIKEYKTAQEKDNTLLGECHRALKKDFEDTREKLYDKMNEMKDAFGPINVTVARTEQMVKNNADIQRIMQKDIGEIRERLNKK